MQKHIEITTANEILETPDIIKIDGKEYHVAPPTPATLIRASSIISEFPAFTLDNPDQLVPKMLEIAKDYTKLGMLAAVLIIGETRTKKEQSNILKRIFNPEQKKETLADIILHKMSNKELKIMITKLMERLEIGDFFIITTSLNEINILKATKEVEKKTIASGR